MNDNHGLVVTGGSLTVDVLAVGNRARASKSVSEAADRLHTDGYEEVQLKLKALLTALESHQSSLEDPAETYEITDRIAVELKKPAPDKITMKSLLTQIVEETKAIAEVAVAAAALKGAVGNFF